MSPGFFARVASALVLLAMTAVPNRTHAEGAPIYTLICSKVGLPLYVTLNDVKIDRSEGDGDSSFAKPLNLWLRPGRNQLRVRTTPGAQIAKDANVFCKVIRNAPGDIVSTRDNSRTGALVLLEWPAKGRRATGTLDQTLQLSVGEKDAPACELWKRAEKLTLDDTTRAAVLDAVRAFEAALRAGNAEKVLAIQRFAGEDRCRCMGEDLEAYRRDGPERVAFGLKQLAGGTFQAWDPAQAKVELVAGGLVAQVTVNDAAPIVFVSKDGKERRTFAPFIAKIDGAFIMVR